MKSESSSPRVLATTDLQHNRTPHSHPPIITCFPDRRQPLQVQQPSIRSEHDQHIRLAKCVSVISREEGTTALFPTQLRYTTREYNSPTAYHDGAAQYAGIILVITAQPTTALAISNTMYVVLGPAKNATTASAAIPHLGEMRSFLSLPLEWA